MEGNFDFIAVSVAAVAAMLLGGIWYSPILFGKRWRELVSTPGEGEPGNPAVIYGGAFVLMLLGSAVFHAFLGPDPEFAFAAGVGLAAGFAWAAGSLWVSYLFEGRPRGLYLINGGFHVLQYTTYGVVFGLM